MKEQCKTLCKILVECAIFTWTEKALSIDKKCVISISMGRHYDILWVEKTPYIWIRTQCVIFMYMTANMSSL